MTSKPIDWARQYAATITDATSLRHMRGMAQKALDNIHETRGMLDNHPDVLAEWDADTAQDVSEATETIELCEAGLVRLGLSREDF